ncbi:MAG: prohibitin family protein, partial [Clostridia bacterium]|nr:prohibitin family protein [Clostridia bacterium]
QQQLLKAETEKQTKITNAQAEAEVKVTQAEAEAKANRLLNQELTEKIIQKQFIEKWDGKLPVVSGEGSILNIPEELFKSAAE